MSLTDIIVSLYTKILKKYFRVSQNQVTTKTYVTASFSTRKPEIDLLTLHDHNKIWLQFSKIEELIHFHIQFSILR